MRVLPITHLLLLLLVATIPAGCGASSLDVARHATLYTGSAIMASARSFDAARPSLIENIRVRSFNEFPNDQPARLHRIDELALPMKIAARVITVAMTGWLALREALDAWENESDEGPWEQTAACVALSLTRLASVLDTLDIQIPAPLVTARGALSKFAEMTCDVPDLQPEGTR